MRAASLKLTVVVLFDTTWMGICTPCLISASPLFWVDTRGVERMRTWPLVSAADSATSRLNAPLTEPSANPIALTFVPDGATAGRFTAFVCPGIAAPDTLALLGNA